MSVPLPPLPPPPCDRFFSKFAVLFDRRAHQRDYRVVLVELAVFELLRDRVGRAEVDHVGDDSTHSDNRGTSLSGFTKITYSVKSAYLPSTSFQNSATVFWLMVSKVLIERRMSTSRSGLKVSSITFNGIPARNV